MSARPETRLDPESGELVQRWDPEMPWMRVGGIEDGSTVPEDVVDGWIELVPKPQVSPVSTADQEGPEQGHTWRFTVEGRSSGGIWLSGDDRPAAYEDAPYFSGEVWHLEVRGWSLVEGLRRAAQLGLGAWRRPDGKRLDEA